MLILNATVDLLYVIDTALSIPNVVFSSGVIFILWENPIVHRRSFDVYTCLMVQTFFIYLSVLILPIQFIYRYSVISSNGYTFSTVLKVLAGCFAYLTIHCSFLSYTYQSPAPVYDAILRGQGVAEEDLIYVAGDKDANWWLIPHFGSCMLMTVASYTTIIVVYIKTQKVLQQFEAHMTVSTRRAQRQMTRIILLQAFYPVVLLCFPSFFMAFGPLINVKSDYLGIVCEISVHLIPILNSIAVVSCIPSYRRVTWRIIQQLKQPMSFQGKYTKRVDNESAGCGKRKPNKHFNAPPTHSQYNIQYAVVEAEFPIGPFCEGRVLMGRR
ncbi:unnamed protein product [Bursaphelenchus xylophilus]|uniref:(pine wood nematode) hypothetical protein n=1 Tax=Bursaphelenchus xylophilus TaxID=6326 RepID=A0A1I7SQE5_BURXY|nr:unnamed protein product [Bursaphelenchus xylophilus]CAG9109790.1 unnamed protein product [Bursaphelenchus xylophilus]